MSQAADPFYNRKPVPDELIQDIGPSGLSKNQEFENREKKFFHMGGGDVRNFFRGSSGDKGQPDPFYNRKPIPDSMLEGVGVTGLSREEEEMNRERKYSLSGVDVRKFGDSEKSFFEPAGDPYYNRGSVSKAGIAGVGELDMTPAEVYEQRDRKQSMVQFSSDPFQQLSGAGHRQGSISGAAFGASNLATQRRRSSATPAGVAAATTQHHSGFDGDKLEPIQSRAEVPTTTTTTTTTAAADDRIMEAGRMSSATESTAVGANGHAEHHDPDSVAPHEVR